MNFKSYPSCYSNPPSVFYHYEEFGPPALPGLTKGIQLAAGLLQKDSPLAKKASIAN